MSGLRESVFECIYASQARRRTAHVRAWNAEEAIELFARELLDDGVEEGGEISVAVPGDPQRRRSVYRSR